jgi:hypothetical protein
MEHAIAAAGDTTLTLYATDRGKPLYEKLGFRSVARVANHVGRLEPLAEMGSRLASEADLGQILELDRPACGVDRGGLLRAYTRFASHLRVIDSVGYAGAWRNGDLTIIGPLVAANARAAEQLVSDLARDIDGPIRLDISDGHPELAEWAVRRGLRPNFFTDVMVARGDLPGERDRVFLPIMQALG